MGTALVRLGCSRTSVPNKYPLLGPPRPEELTNRTESIFQSNNLGLDHEEMSPPLHHQKICVGDELEAKVDPGYSTLRREKSYAIQV